MSNYQEKTIAALLNDMARTAVTELYSRPLGETIGRLQYLIWEARQTLDLPDFPGLKPI